MFRLSLLIILLLPTFARAEPPKPTMTIFVYAAGDEEGIKESTWSFLKKLEKIPALADRKIQIVVQHDDVGDDPNYRYLIEPAKRARPGFALNSRPIPEADIRKFDKSFRYGETDSGSPITFKKFLQWGVQAYPAESYAVVMAGHSWGQFGFMQDFRVGGKDLDLASQMKPFDVAQVMKEIYTEDRARKTPLIPKGKFDLLVIDGCNAGQIEAAYEMVGAFKYLAANSLETPFNSIPYESILQDYATRVAQAGNAAHDDKFIEEHLIKPLVTHYIDSHGPKGKLAKQEGQVDVIASFAIRLDEVPRVTHALADLLKTLPAKEHERARRRLPHSVFGLRDNDENIDLLQLARAYEEHAREALADPARKADHAQLERALKAAERLRDSLGYRAAEGTLTPVKVSHAGAKGAWAEVEIDPYTERNDLAVSQAIKALARSNPKASYVPTAHDKEGKRKDLTRGYFNELAEEEGHEEKATSLGRRKPVGDAKPITSFLGYELDYHGDYPIYFTAGEKRGKHTPRKLWIWVENGDAPILQLPGTARVKLHYVDGDPLAVLRGDASPMKTETVNVAPFQSVTDEAQLGKLYVAEGHSAGTPFKHGLGTYWGGKLARSDVYYQGPLPLWRVEDELGIHTLEEYFAYLERLTPTERKKYLRKGNEFYRMYRIGDLGVPDFLWGPARCARNLRDVTE